MLMVVAAAVLAAGHGAATSSASAYTTLYAFGDSLSDFGNIYAASGGLFPIAPYCEGRFSNGPNWRDDLSAKLGLGAVAPSAHGGHDFAVGGAQTGATAVNRGTGLVDLDQQVKAFELADPSREAGALYTLDIGANDIGAALSAFGPDEAALSMFMAQAVGNAVTAIDDLYADGARNLFYYEVPDLSAVPAFKKYGALAGTLAKAFNDRVLAGIAPLQANGLTILVARVFSTLDAIVADPAKYGFANVADPCFTGGPKTAGAECANPDQYVFWDTEHPTAAAHAATAEVAYQILRGSGGNAAVPEPSTWSMMLAGLAGLGLMGVRKGATARA